ncbi:MAG TPA: mucoidy inhibitor MuiA family protein [Bacteroidales bacterium]
MKTIATLIVCFLFSQAFSQEITEKEIKTDVNGVTVFIDGAQVTRKKAVDLLPGVTMLKFVNLSPFIDARSVQVKAEGEVTVLSVNHQQNYLDKSSKLKEVSDLQSKCKELDDKIQLENTYLSIIREELAFLQQNRSIGGSTQSITVTNLKEISEFYSAKLTSLKIKEIERTKTVNDLTAQKADLENQIKSLTGIREFPKGEVLVKTETKKPVHVVLEISYVVSNASWFPTYDIRAKNINEPVQLIYKANVRQDTKEEWKDVKLRFSSSNPNRSGIAPELKTYFLNYFTPPPTYNLSNNMVKGCVMDNNHTPLPGVSVMVPGTTIGAVTDVNGNYTIVVPNNASTLTYSYIGYTTENKPITNQQMNITLNEDVKKLEEVTVVGYGTQEKSDITGSIMVRGISTIKGNNSVKIRGSNILPLPFAQIEKQTTVDFEIKTPYTIKSDNKSYTIDMDAYSLPANYKYYCVPKVDKDAFLMAYIVDWEKYNLLEGEANIFFEDTYIGKTLLDVRHASDTLSISLGRDKNVSVNRQKVKEFTTKQFLGSKKEESRAWTITVKNNKREKINLVLLDQVPVSTLEEIEVNVQKISGAQYNSETGEIKWDFSLEPDNKKDFELNYSVKYPKYRNLAIE